MTGKMNTADEWVDEALYTVVSTLPICFSRQKGAVSLFS